MKFPMPIAVPGIRLLLIAVTLVATLFMARNAEAMEIQRVTSPLGVDVWYVREASLPIISANFLFRGAGAATVPVDKEGLAYFVSVMLDEGAGEITSREFQRLLDELSINLGFDANVDTFSADVRTLTARRDEAFRLMGLALASPRFDDEPIERMRAAALSGLTSRLDDPDDIVNRAFSKAHFADPAYGRSVRGRLETFEALTKADLQDYVRTRFTRDRLVVGAVGDVPIEEIARLIDIVVAGLPATGPKFEVAEVRPLISEVPQVIRRDIPQSSVLFGAWGIKRSDPDYYAAMILNTVLGGGSFISRLWEAVREERGLAYSVSTGNAALEHGAYFYGYVATNNEKVAESIAVIRAEIDRVLAEGITVEEMEAAKVYLIGSFALSMDTNTRIARTLVSIQVADLPIDYIEQRAGYYNAVTMEDIRRVARRYFLGDANAPIGPAKLSITVIGNPEGVGLGPKDG